MKFAGRIAIALTSLLLAPHGMAGQKKRTPARSPSRSIGNTADPRRAVGIVDVYLFKNKNISQRCAATHVGNGIMVTAGHCFLGAYDCNDARVSWENESYTSRCQYVLYSNASEAYSNGREISNDLTVFKVDRAPDASVSLAPMLRNSDVQTTAEAIAISTSRSNGGGVTLSSSACNIILGPVVNIFSQPKPSDTARHNCELADISSGSPLLNTSTNQLIALHQGTSLLPDLENAANNGGHHRINFAKVISDIDVQKAIQLPDALPKDIRVGGFAGEVFNTGIKEPLSFKVVGLQARVGETTVSFGLHNGLDTMIETVDGDGKKMIFAGPRRAGYDQRFRMKAPVKVTLTSTSGGLAPLAWIEDIQSP